MNKNTELLRKLIIPNRFLWMLSEEYSRFQLLTCEQRLQLLVSQRSREWFAKLMLGEQLFDEFGDEVFDQAVSVSKYPQFFDQFLTSQINVIESYCQPIVNLLRELAPEPSFYLKSLDPIRELPGDAYLVEALYARHVGTVSTRYLLDTDFVHPTNNC